jgi:hypothetical protein
MTTPRASSGSTLGGLFGKGSPAEQLFVWQVLAQLLGAMLAPGFRELEQLVNHVAPNELLTPADVATAVNRSFMTLAEGITEANGSGIDQARLEILQHLAGNAPAPEELAAALRRSIIPETGSGPAAVSFEQGIAEGNLLNKWGPVIRKLALAIPSPADIIEGQLKGQLDAATAQQLYTEVGGDERFRQLLVNIAGNPPSPTELVDLANRAIIPWTGTGPDVLSVQQGIFEGRTKDKWQPVYKNLAEYRPPPETVRVMLEANGITTDEATAYWASYGMTAKTISQYLLTAQNNRNQAAQGLTESAVLSMYYNQLISRDDAVRFLSLMGIDANNADLLIAYTDMQRAIAALTRAVSRIQTLYIARKIDTATATDALTRLQVPDSAIGSLIHTWDIVASVNVKTLTEAQIIDAWVKGVLTNDRASSELQAIGYTPFDAWVLMATKDAANAGPEPEPTIAAPLGAVIPGVT